MNTKFSNMLEVLCALYFAGTATAEMLAERLGCSRGFVESAIFDLRKAKLIKGRRGNGGGYNLNAPAEGIYLSHLIEIAEAGQKTATHGTGSSVRTLMHPEVYKRLIGHLTVADVVDAIENVKQNGVIVDRIFMKASVPTYLHPNEVY